jgi:glutamate carboxypeptidase
MREEDERRGRPGAENELASGVLAWLRKERDAIRALLERWAAIETPSRAPDTQQPLFAAIARELGELGFATRLLPGRRSGGSLYARPEQRQRGVGAQLLLGHCDTVWPERTLEEMPVDADAERIRGPGVYDMKAGLVQIVFALRALRALGASPALTPIVFVNSDEEIGSRESTAMIRRLARIVERTFVLEPSLGLEGRLKTARKGVGRFTIHVQGRAAHAGLDPEAGISAILELSHVVQELFALNDVERGVSVNVGTIEGGLGANVIAPESSAVVDVRVLTQADAERIERAVLGLEATTPGAELEIEGRIGRPPMERTPGNQALFATAQRLGSEMGLEIEEATAGGGSDGNTTSLFGPTLDGLGAVGDGAHAQHEFVFAERLPERAALLALLLMAEPDRSKGAT